MMANIKYSELQLKIIRGEIPLDTVNGHALRPLYRKALANGNEELVAKLNARFDVLKVENAEKCRQREKIRYDQKKRAEYKWKQPKSNAYSDRHRKIIRGEIPLEDVHTKELISIHLKAHNNGDYELSERILSLIEDRQKEVQFRRNIRKNLYDRKCYTSERNPSLDFIDKDTALTKWDRAVLMGFIDVEECAEEQLERILRIVQKQGDEKKVLIAQKLLAYKQDPASIYVVKDHRAAIDRIEALLQLPIRRPETWFVEE